MEGGDEGKDGGEGGANEEDSEGGASHDEDIEGHDEHSAANSEDEEEGTNYEWFAHIPKDVPFAHTECDYKCRGCSKEVRRGPRVRRPAIDCNMCNFAWHHDCLTPVIEPAACKTPGFFACFPECVREMHTKYAAFTAEQAHVENVEQ